MSQITKDSELVTKEQLAEFYQMILPYLNGGGGAIYDSNERIVGTYFGETLYEKTFKSSESAVYSVSANSVQNYDLTNIGNVNVKQISGSYVATDADGVRNGAVSLFNGVNSSGEKVAYTYYIFVSDEKIKLQMRSAIENKYIKNIAIILRYTKTT